MNACRCSVPTKMRAAVVSVSCSRFPRLSPISNGRWKRQYAIDAANAPAHRYASARICALRAFRVSVLAFVVCGVAAAGVMAAIIPNEALVNRVIKACVVGLLAALFAHARASGAAEVEHAALSERAIALLAGVGPAAVVVAAALIVVLAGVGYQPLSASADVSLEDAARCARRWCEVVSSSRRRVTVGTAGEHYFIGLLLCHRFAARVR